MTKPQAFPARGAPQANRQALENVRACRSRLSHRLSRSSPADGPRRVAGEAGQAAGEADSDRQTETRATMGLLEDAIATYSYVGLWISLSEKKSLE
jgi:hypothetical protein